MAAESYRSAELVFGWSFYRQDTSGGTSSADEFLNLLSFGLATQIHGLARRGRRANDWQSSSHIVEPCLFWTAWSRSKIRLVHKRGEYTILHSRRLLGSYLTDAYNGDIRHRKEVSKHLGHDVRQGTHARKVMESYQTWFGEGPELSVLRMLGLFDRPAEEKAIAALLKPPAIPGQRI
jgi:hypothetical protein